VRDKGKDQRESPQRWWAEKFVVPIVVAILGTGRLSATIVAVIQRERVLVVASPKPDPPGIHYFTASLNLLSGVSEYSINLYMDGRLAGTFSGDIPKRTRRVAYPTPLAPQIARPLTNRSEFTQQSWFA
jgi:hypothetical protein